MTRRLLLAMLAAQTAMRAQRSEGMASRGVAPTPRGKPSGRPFHARFTDVAEQAGLRTPIIYGYPDHCDYILETMGAGIAFLDYDNDGWLDIFELSGTRMDAAPPGATNRLYRNNRNGTFTDVTEKAGLHRLGWAFGVTVGDYNNDGFEDLFVTYWGQNVLYRNNGDGTFTDVTKEAGLLCPARWGSGCTWVDYDRDGRLDLFVSNYLKFDPKRIPKTGENALCNWKGVPVNCGPRGLPTETQQLFHNNGDGTFSEVTEKSGIGKVKGSYGLTAAAADFNDDGWPDIYVACDSTPGLLFTNKHDGTFTEEGLESGIALSEDGAEQAGMGVAVGDYNLDGRLDIFKTHFAEDTPVLYRGEGKGAFTDVTIRAGLGVETRFVVLGHWARRSGQRRIPRHLRGHGKRVPGSTASTAWLPPQDAAVHLSQSGRWQIRTAHRGSRSWDLRPARQPRCCLRRLRQRWRRGYSGDESERAAIAAAQ